MLIANAVALHSPVSASHPPQELSSTGRDPIPKSSKDAILVCIPEAMALCGLNAQQNHLGWAAQDSFAIGF